MASKRDIEIKFRVTKEEDEHLKKGQMRANYATKASYVREMALNARPNPDFDLDAAALAERLGEIGFLINELDPRSNSEIQAVSDSFNALREEAHLIETARRCGLTPHVTLGRKKR